jgi:hypothetical protein
VNILDDERGLQLMTPRKPKSGWTRRNRRRVAALEAQGRMTDAGRQAVEVAKANGWWTIYDAVEDLREPDDLADALDASRPPGPLGTDFGRRPASRCCGGSPTRPGPRHARAALRRSSQRPCTAAAPPADPRPSAIVNHRIALDATIVNGWICYRTAYTRGADRQRNTAPDPPLSCLSFCVTSG